MAEKGFELCWKGGRPEQHSPSWPAGLRLVPCRCDCAGAGPGGTGPGGASVREPAPLWEDPPPPSPSHSLCLLPKATVRVSGAWPPLRHAPPGRAAVAGSGTAGLPWAPKFHRPPGRVSAHRLQVWKRGQLSAPQEPAGVLLGLPTTTRENCQFLWPQALPGQQWAVCGCLSVGTCLLCWNS